ncbi:hypothetical protein [Roseomonas sp. BN140053]|uniref:hypothetical protein n=1 Tax=Roseomonas sp. BN140053 TaxID=3391898 RepID=UPI0039E84BE1
MPTLDDGVEQVLRRMRPGRMRQILRFRSRAALRLHVLKQGRSFAAQRIDPNRGFPMRPRPRDLLRLRRSVRKR